MRCDKCRHWKKDSDNEEWEAAAAGMGECMAVRERWRIAETVSRKNDEYISELGKVLRAAKAYVQDGSEYRAELFTAPDFFCALYQEADESQPNSPAPPPRR